MPRYGSATRALACQLIGAVRLPTTAEERRDGAESIAWDTGAVTALPESWCRRYAKELAGHLKRGELVEVSAPETKKALP